jgi:transposase-like protein
MPSAPGRWTPSTSPACSSAPPTSKARVDHRIVSDAIVIATGVTQGGGREVVGVMVGDSETGVFRARFVRHLRGRGLNGVRPVISGIHSGLVKAIRQVVLGAARQHCRVRFVRDVLAVIPKGPAETVAATIRTVFAQPTADAVRARLDTLAGMPGRQFPKIQEMPREAKEDLTAFPLPLPQQRWKKIQSANPLERLNRETRRRTDVVQVFPRPTAVPRPATAVLAELHDERTAPAAASPPRAWTPSTPKPRRHDRPARRVGRLIACTTTRDITGPRQAEPLRARLFTRSVCCACRALEGR